MLPFSDEFWCQPWRDETEKEAFRYVYNARTLKDLNCPSTITKNLYFVLKNLDILKPFRGCRSGKSVKGKLKDKKLNIQTHHQRCELKLHASKNTRNCKSNASNLVNIKLNSTSKAISSHLPLFFTTNACHLTNKLDELRGVVEINNVSVAVITESWLSSNIPDSAIALSTNFTSYRLDRKSLGGGVIAYVSSEIPIKRMNELEVEGKEILWLLLKPSRMPRPFSTILLIGVYSPPGQSVELMAEIIKSISDGIEAVLCERPSSGILITGDFNKLNLESLCRQFGLRKLVKSPTRGNAILDQFLTNMPHLFEPVVHLPPLGRSDHQSLLLKPKHRIKLPPVTKKFRPMKPGNLQTLQVEMCKETWESVINAVDVDDKVSIFNTLVANMLNIAMPEKSVRVHATDKPWITPHIKNYIKERQSAYTNGDKDKYAALCVKVADLISKAKCIYYQDKAKNNRFRDPAKWYRSIYKLAGADSSMSTLGAPTRTELQELSEKLQGIFTAPWRDLSISSIDLDEVRNLLKDKNPVIPSIGQVKSALVHLDARKASGSDGVHSWLLKRFSEDLAAVVHNIFEASIVQCKYPTAYKHGLISPVPKVYPPKDINTDFRQISVLPQLGKVLERLQLKLNNSDLQLNDTQHAFTAKRSTVSALINITQNWFNATDNKSNGKNGVHALFIDFRKAFDLVDHRILLLKLAKLNINKHFWLWIRSFLSQRSQQVNLQGILSTSMPCPAGVPQGSVISPILFNVFVNDLEDSVPKHRTVNTCKYADDCTQDELIYPDSQSNMQEVVDAVSKWANDNKMELNTKKTKDMWICFRKAMREPPKLTIGNNVIERVENFKLLGVWQQNNLKWNMHVFEIIRKANKKLFHLRECRRSKLPVEVGLTTYISKIRPILEYASPVWGGLPKYLEKEIEQVQIRSMKIIGLPKDHLLSLKGRREEATRRELQKIQRDSGHPCFKFLPAIKTHKYNLRNQNNDLNMIISGTDRHKNSFIPRACRN